LHMADNASLPKPPKEPGKVRSDRPVPWHEYELMEGAIRSGRKVQWPHKCKTPQDAEDYVNTFVRSNAGPFTSFHFTVTGGIDTLLRAHVWSAACKGRMYSQPNGPDTYTLWYESYTDRTGGFSVVAFATPADKQDGVYNVSVWSIPTGLMCVPRPSKKPLELPGSHDITEQDVRVPVDAVPFHRGVSTWVACQALAGSMSNDMRMVAANVKANDGKEMLGKIRDELVKKLLARDRDRIVVRMGQDYWGCPCLAWIPWTGNDTADPENAEEFLFFRVTPHTWTDSRFITGGMLQFIQCPGLARGLDAAARASWKLYKAKDAEEKVEFDKTIEWTRGCACARCGLGI